MELAENILNRFNISKPQRKFLLILFTTILIARGKINFRNLSRYSDLCEQTYSRQFAKPFDFVGYNRSLIDLSACVRMHAQAGETFGEASERILAFDPTFVSTCLRAARKQEAGKHTFSRDYFWNGPACAMHADRCANQAQKGLEISALAVVDINQNQALTLSARQTFSQEEALQMCGVSTLSDLPAAQDAAQAGENETRMGQYLEHIRAASAYFTASEQYLTVDGSFANANFIDGVSALGLDVIGKLRCDLPVRKTCTQTGANMRYLYEGPKRPGRGRQKTYDGKVDWQDLSRLDYVGKDEHITLYTKLLNHVKFERILRIVVLVKHTQEGTPRHVILFSTDENLDAWKVYQYYKLRFQIEFLFRDAKQFTGLPVCVHRTGRCDCQARDQKRLDFHFNASLTTLNLAKAELTLTQENDQSVICSMASVKALYFNQHYLDRIIRISCLRAARRQVGLDPTWIKKRPEYQMLREYGKIAA